MKTIGEMIKWLNQTATLIGYPVLVLGMFLLVEKLLFTGSCMVSGYQCEFSFFVWP